MQDLLDILGAMVSKKAEIPDQHELLLDVGERIVKRLTGAFQVKPDEIAILLLTADNRHLRFVAPRRLTDLGTIPLTKRDSIAVTILGRRVGEANNNVPMVKHVAFFEAVKLRDRPVPIQKMITVPILLHGKDAVGVAQISRKGESPKDAGPDFGGGDVKRAQDIFQVIAPYLAQARPTTF